MVPKVCNMWLVLKLDIFSLLRFHHDKNCLKNFNVIISKLFNNTV